MPGGRPRRQSPKYNSLQAMGENIRAIRKHMQLNQKDFGRMFGVTQMTVTELIGFITAYRAGVAQAIEKAEAEADNDGD